MKLCIYCQKRANRYCPALAAEICSQCCGRYRRVAIQCSENCRFLLESRRQALKKLLNYYGNSEYEMEWFELLHDLRFALVQVKQRTAPGMNDTEVIDTLTNIIENRRVQAAGLIYEYKSVNPNVQQATAALLKVISQYEESKALTGLTAPNLNNSLKYLLLQAQAVRKNGADFIKLISACVGTKFINIDRSLISLS
jgi:hypothetical protein